MAGQLIPIRNVTSIDWTSPKSARFNFNSRFGNAFLANEWLSDVSFLVDQDDRLIPAHSLFVGAASPMLERCCFGRDGVPSATKPITVPDYCSAETFDVVLRFIYTGILASRLNGIKAAAVLKIADYFDLHELMNHCSELIKPQLSTDNVCQVFNQIHHVEIELTATCLMYMKQNIKTLLDNKHAMRMSDEALRILLSMDDLGIVDETALVAPMIRWADDKCATMQIKPTPANRRLVLGARLHLIRFATMEFGEFMESYQAFGEDVFTDAEVTSTVKCIHSKMLAIPIKTTTCPFSTVNRRPVNEFEIPFNSSRTAHLSVFVDVTVYQCPDDDKPIAITGLRFITAMAKSMHIVNLITEETITGTIRSTDPKTIRFDKPILFDRKCLSEWRSMHLKIARKDGGRFESYMYPTHSENPIGMSCVDALLSKAV